MTDDKLGAPSAPVKAEQGEAQGARGARCLLSAVRCLLSTASVASIAVRCLLSSASAASAQEVSGVLGGLLGEFVVGDCAEGGDGAEDAGEVAGLIVEQLVLAEDEGVAADGEAIGGSGLDEEAVEGEVGEECWEEARGGFEDAAADAEPDIRAFEEGEGEQLAREADAVELPGADALGPRFEEAEEEGPGARAVENDWAAEADGEVELGG